VTLASFEDGDVRNPAVRRLMERVRMVVDDRIGDSLAEQAWSRVTVRLTDGRVIAATAAGHTLYYRRTPGSVTVASEPGDDQAGWTKVPRGSAVTATAEQVSVTRLPALDSIVTGSATAHETSSTSDGRNTI